MELKPCPFCGSDQISLGASRNGKVVFEQGDTATVKCLDCGVAFEHVVAVPQHYELVDGDLYRKIPTKYAEEVAAEKWNRRAYEVEK